MNDLAAAADGGALEDPEIVLTRTPLELDEKAWKKLDKLLAKTHEQALAIAADSAARGTDGVFATELGVLHFKRAATPGLARSFSRAVRKWTARSVPELA